MKEMTICERDEFARIPAEASLTKFGLGEMNCVQRKLKEKRFCVMRAIAISQLRAWTRNARSLSE
jgi:hypothetical protein